MSRAVGCPSWCAGGHRCTARFGTGEHRSEPLSLSRPGRRVAVVVTLSQRRDRMRPTAELRVVVRLTASDSGGQVVEVGEVLRRVARAVQQEQEVA